MLLVSRCARLRSLLRAAVAVVPTLALLATAGSTAVAAPAPNPPVSTGLQLWFEADTTSGADGARVTQWPDKSGFARDLSAQGTTTGAIMRRNAINGRAALEFDGVGSVMKTYSKTFTLAQPTTFFIVYKSLDPSTAARAFIFDSRNSSVRQVFGRAAAGNVRLYANSDLDFGGITYPFSAFQIWNGTFNGTSSTLARNGVSVGAGYAGFGSLSGLTLGGLNNSGTTGYDLSHSLVAEVLYYTGALSQAQRDQTVSWLNEKYSLISAPGPPTMVNPPTISGATKDTATLTADPGTWNGTQPIGFAYQWQRCPAVSGPCQPISGATNATYVATADDIGSRLAVGVTASNGAGGTSATSAQSAVVTASAPASTAPPAITGVFRSGGSLHADNGAWTGTAPIAYAYQWQRCNSAGASCSDVPSGTSADLALGNGDIGSTFRVIVTASNGAGATPITSGSTVVIGAATGSGPPVTTGLQLWYEAGAESYANGAAVTRWHDASGFGRDLTAGSAAAAGRFRTGAVNGRPAVEFDGVSSLLKTYETTFSLPQPTTFFIVYKSLDQNTAARAFVFDSRNSSVRQVLGRPAQGSVRLYANADLDFAGFDYPFPTFELWNGTFNGSNSSLYENGMLVGSGNAGVANQEGFAVGGLNSAGTNGYDLSHSLVAEILYYNGALDAPSRAAVTNWLNTKYQVIETPAVPTNATPPSVAGTAADGAQLTADKGLWNGSSPISYAYAWQRCDTAGANCTPIPQATATTYTATSADIGSRLRVVVTASNSAGTSSPAASATTAVVAAAPATNTGLPAITGTAKEGSTLTADRGAWSGTLPIAYSYQWRRCDQNGANCTNVPGATGTTFVPTALDIGRTLRLDVTGTNGAGTATATSAATLVIVSSGSSSSAQPPVLAGLQLWYDADSQNLTDGQSVARWSDRSGYGRDLTAAGAAQPLYRRNAVNGRAAIEFDGVSSMMKTYESTFTLSQPTTFFVVYKSLDPPTGSFTYVFDSRDSLTRQLHGRGPYGVETYANTDIYTPDVIWPFPGFELWGGTFDGTNSTVWRQGNQVSAGYAGFSGLSGFAVGGLSTAGTDGYWFGHTLVSEVLYYSGSMSDQDRAAVNAWLNAKYATY